ncbi:MAG: hypothetical protein IKT12_02915 [Thermoguttaceae bacterium]|nr:hypothetical protein [Thermoguttaceae bacterium]
MPVFAPIGRSFDIRFHLPVSVEGELVSMSLRRYVLGAVLGEMPADFAPEALKAQAVACRTYALKQYTQRKHGAAAVCTDPGCCMNWTDPEAYEETYGEAARNKIEAAVEETDGMVILYQGELKELGRVDDLLKVSDETEIRTRGLSEAAMEKIKAVIAEENAELLFCGSPTTSLENLFLDIIQESEARPGKRVRGGGNA